MTQRHNALRDALSHLLTQCGIPHRKEVMAANSSSRPADILLCAWDLGRDAAVDLTISHPASLSCYPLRPTEADRHLGNAEAAKREAEGAACGASRWSLYPAAFSPWGGAGPGARHLLFHVLQRGLSDLHGWAQARRRAEALQGLSLVLARSVAAQLELRCRVVDLA